jgi:multidrug efflux pump subunit AcrB
MPEGSGAIRLHGGLLGRIAPVREESGGFLVTMLFAVIIVFLALAAQFESFRDPMVILFSVPMALFGAMTLSSSASPPSTSTPRWGW